jgi:hypothetical protein
MPAILAKGSRVSKDGETWVDWWLLPKLDDASAWWTVNEVLDLSYIGGNPGGVYMRKPVIKQGKRFTLIRQSCGLDI